MPVTFTDGTITTNGTEQTVFDVTSDKHYGFWLFCHNMQAGDSLRVRISVKDQNAATMRLYLDDTLSGVQASPAFFTPYLTTKQFKVTVQRTAGTDRAYTWQRAEVP